MLLPAGLLAALAACSPGATGSAGHAAGTATPISSPSAVNSATPSASPVAGIPAAQRQAAMDWAAHAGESPRADQAVVVQSAPGNTARLLWQAEQTGDVCWAEPSGGSVASGCLKAADLGAGTAPGLHVFGDALPTADGQLLEVLFRADGETVARLSCGPATVVPQQVAEFEVNGVRRTFYLAAIDRHTGGSYTARVQRAGAAAADSLLLYAEAHGSC
ncbi:hypothetical protein C7C46_23835 [Streptomyces tateyamensis]|uniref:Lipoprotein n=1 Tax=Streptomyces tateyamensis TaxID=565073 RepID=A0A2V4NB66_9ACTN|nr:hypothetical protein C7C46_23835 [Streptomyces tateyamensis]